MANQIIACPAALLRGLIHSVSIETASASGPIRLDPIGGIRAFEAIAVKIFDRRFNLFPNIAGSEPTFVLLLTTEANPDPSYQPLPLPDDLVLEKLDRLAEFLAMLTFNSGHDRLELGLILETARNAPNRSPIPHPVREPENNYEAGIQREAKTLGSKVAPVMAAFDRKLARYRGKVLQEGLGAVLRPSPKQGAVSDRLRQEPGHRPNGFGPGLGAAGKFELSEVRRQTLADATAAELVAAGSALHVLASQPSSSAQHLLALYRGADIDGRWRQDGTLWRDSKPEAEPDLPEAMPVKDLWRAMSAFPAAFDRKLLATCHPVVRVALAFREFA